MTTNQTLEAREVLELMGSPDSDAELQEIIDSIHMERGENRESLFQSRYKLPIFLAISVESLNSPKRMATSTFSAIKSRNTFVMNRSILMLG